MSACVRQEPCLILTRAMNNMKTVIIRAVWVGITCFALSATITRPAQAQSIDRTPLTLEEAVQEALAGNAGLRVDEARAEAARAARRGAAASLLPRVDLVSGWMRSDDPVAVFGTKLRQGTFTQADFDLGTLNTPGPRSDWSTAVSAAWTLVNPSGWAETRVAGSRARAADWSYRRSREAVRLTTETLYLDLVRADALVTAASRAEDAGRENADLFARREAQGMLTRAESLQAESESAAATAARIDAERARHDAAERLALFLGWPPHRLPDPADDLWASPESLQAMMPEPGPSATRAPIEDRFDLRARRAELEASRASHRSATAAWLPSVVASGRYGVHSTDAFGSEGDNWSLAVGLRWSVFAGGSRVALSDRTRAELRIAETMYQQSVNEAVAEVSAAARALGAAEQTLEASVAARVAADAGTQLMRRRFEEGLATASDLLSAESRLASSERREIDARATHRLAEARLRFVTSHEQLENRR